MLFRSTFFKLESAANFMITLPVAVEPVKATLSIFGWLAIAAPVVAPKPGTMLTTPFGIPASTNNWERYKADNGVDSAGFKTVVQPVALKNKSCVSTKNP